VPTLVEVKRSDDTRIRREVVGQMLDYAANGVVYWPGEVLICSRSSSASASATPISRSTTRGSLSDSNCGARNL
jgi:hypothetical protein